MEENLYDSSELIELRNMSLEGMQVSSESSKIYAGAVPEFLISDWRICSTRTCTALLCR
jgi:hypothetical protein